MVQIEEKQRFSKKFRKRKIIFLSCCVCLFIFQNAPAHAKTYYSPDGYTQWTDKLGQASFWQKITDTYGDHMAQEIQMVTAFILLNKKPIFIATTGVVVVASSVKLLKKFNKL